MEGPGQASVHTSADSEVPKSESVCVAVHVRPLIEAELLEGCESSLSVTPGLPQVCGYWLEICARMRSNVS